MAFWLILALLGLVKLVVASLMLWLPFRSDAAMDMRIDDGRGSDADADDDGGSKTLPGSPSWDPHPRLPLPRPPRRGPHGSSPEPGSPARVRGGRSSRRIAVRG
jgi:hypothetical protein